MFITEMKQVPVFGVSLVHGVQLLIELERRLVPRQHDERKTPTPLSH